MRPILKTTPLKKLSSFTSTPGQSTAGTRVIVQPSGSIRPVESTELANISRITAGARDGQNGFTCVRCLQWFPGGTQHACQRYAETIKQPGMQPAGPMTAAEIVLLQEAGQL